MDARIRKIVRALGFTAKALPQWKDRNQALRRHLLQLAAITRWEGQDLSDGNVAWRSGEPFAATSEDLGQSCAPRAGR